MMDDQSLEQLRRYVDEMPLYYTEYESPADRHLIETISRIVAAHLMPDMPAENAVMGLKDLHAGGVLQLALDEDAMTLALALNKPNRWGLSDEWMDVAAIPLSGVGHGKPKRLVPILKPMASASPGRFGSRQTHRRGVSVIISPARQHGSYCRLISH